jgi:hypothetical protein
MPPNPHRLARATTLVAALVFVAGGCGGGAAAVASASPTIAPSASPTHSSKPTPSRSPTPSPTRPPSPTPAPTPSLIASLKIGSPYELVFNPANPALSGSFSFQMGSVTVSETLSGREIHQRTKLVGLAYVLEIDGFPMNDAAFEGGARGAAANSGGTLTYTTILGHRVALVVAKTASFAMYRYHDAIVMVGAASLSLTKTLATSMLRANP